ncbi:4-(cytidine 5'-diphospho)-2-C-methyl-D-erythritol kinase [Desulfovibrio legallii]|uniref:4-diphosphocytidyl-2-C-methyl-D-erythritol kinase n=1 Tax=Desulfovibrio legallii TaxID=571438 RepID=A0A1G7MWR0_9BACT|nr:4-(cytidine 5'-diphospho)-2-C-methyl-D-erythritol kinase [Desulfovibrio legallii]SDF66184.1 4-diphosphocytidyl-2-C-methyl-D-erythritol kinase [Desulfovibrio legallii]
MNILVAGCKINLGLRIIGRRADGYHELDSLFCPLARPCDRLRLRVTEGRGLHVRCDAPGLNPEDNTLTRAYAAFAAATDAADLPGLEITLRKGIPLGSGLGGGSSDAAALLRWLNARAPRPLDQAALTAVGLRVGADVPFFLQPGPELKPCRVRGVGEIVEPAGAHLAGLRLVLVCPPASVSTAQAYADFDAAPKAAPAPDGPNDLTKADAGANGTFLSEARPAVDLHNDLEAVVFARHPQLGAIKAQLLRLGAFAAAMSGSGSSIIGLFQLEALVEARAAAALLQEEGWRVYAHTL